MQLQSYKAVQRVAKQVLAELCEVIGPDSTEHSIALYSSERLSALGFPDTWYHSCPALVLAGSRSCLSIPGREYVPNTEPVGEENLVTVDLSPCAGSIWGDCARSFVVEDGKVSASPLRPEFYQGLEAEKYLHVEMQKFVSPDTSFHALYEFSNNLIASMGYVNVDFRGNVGHSIATDLEGRIYIEVDNHQELADVPLFTFEPHIRHKDGAWGFKHEDIYYFDDAGDLAEL